MAKSKILTPQQKTNRNNKIRGKNFENKMAELLGWFRVPLSGSSAVFGWCDIRDSENLKEGIWLGECKTMTPSNPLDKVYTIKMDWLRKLVVRSSEEQKMPMLAFTLFGEVDKFIAIPKPLALMICDHIPSINPYFDMMRFKRKSKTQVNYTILRSYLMDYRFRAVRSSKMNTLMWNFGFEDECNGSGWVFMHMSEFIKFHKDPRLSLVHKLYYDILNRKEV